MLVVTRVHPIRFAVERAERDGIELGDAYDSMEPYSYQSRWNPELTLTHARFPHKQAWLARYLGIIIFRARPLT